MMKKELFDNIKNRLENMPGDVSMVCEYLESGERFEFNPDIPLIAASVIKLPMMVALFKLVQEGKALWDEMYSVSRDVKVPSCGALTYLHDGIQVTLRDLCTLMIILSDNTATNMVFDRVGAEYVNETMRSLGCGNLTLRRKMFDAESSAKGIQNHITAKDICKLLLLIAKKECVSPDADEEMIKILGDQRLNGKIPFFLHAMDIDVAHKTGEDSGTTHDAGIVFSQCPFVVVFLSNNTDVPVFERFIQDASLELASD